MKNHNFHFMFSDELEIKEMEQNYPANNWLKKKKKKPAVRTETNLAPQKTELLQISLSLFKRDYRRHIFFKRKC